MDYIKDQVYFVLYFINIFILNGVQQFMLVCCIVLVNRSNWPKFTPSGSFERIIN